MKDLDINILKKHPVFAAFHGHEDFDVLDGYVQRVKLNAGDSLFKEGEKGNFLSFILNGNLDIIKHSIHKKSVKVASLRQGMSVGEMSIIDQLRRSATVTASIPTELIELPKEQFDALLEAHHALGIKLLKGVARSMSLSLRRASNRLADSLPPIV